MFSILGVTNPKNSDLQSLALSHTFVYFAIAIPAAKGERASMFTPLQVLQLTHHLPCPSDSVLKLCTRRVRDVPFYFPTVALFERSISTRHSTQVELQKLAPPPGH